MYFLRSCTIIYDDLTSREIEECDGIMSLFTMPNIEGVEIIILLTCILITIYFLLKIILLFKNSEQK